MFDWTMGFILCSTIINCDMDTFALLTPHTFIFFFISFFSIFICFCSFGMYRVGNMYNFHAREHFGYRTKSQHTLLSVWKTR